MFKVVTEYEGQGADVVGRTFDTREEAVEFVEARGWFRDSWAASERWMKHGPTTMCGMVGVRVAQYVHIAEE